MHHSGEEYIYVLEGRIEIHTEFYDPIVLEAGESIYIDSNMGHAYVAAEGCDEATVLGVCSSADEGLMESLMELHGDEDASAPASSDVERPAPIPLKHRSRKAPAPGTARRPPESLGRRIRKLTNFAGRRSATGSRRSAARLHCRTRTARSART